MFLLFIVLTVHVSFHSVTRELQTLVGVLRIKVRDGDMTNLRIQKRVRKGLHAGTAVRGGFRPTSGDDEALDKSDGREGKRSRSEPRSAEDRHWRDEKRSKRHGDDECGARSKEDDCRRDEKRSKRHVDDGFEPSLMEIMTAEETKN
ncbi:hypothetical protein PTKIN_Ptkin03bG0051800 [Pterospermum kingtungense]